MKVTKSQGIDYDEVRKAFARTMQAALELDSNHVVQLQTEAPPSPRPSLPHAGFMLTGLGQTYGRDAHYVTDSQDEWIYAGPRMLTATFQFYGTTHEEAFAFCSAWHSALDQEPTQDMLLSLAGISVWSRQPPTDISSMLFTGYEGRASFSASFGVQAQSTVTMGTIEQVSVTGQVSGGGDSISITIDGTEG